MSADINKEESQEKVVKPVENKEAGEKNISLAEKGGEYVRQTTDRIKAGWSTFKDGVTSKWKKMTEMGKAVAEKTGETISDGIINGADTVGKGLDTVLTAAENVGDRGVYYAGKGLDAVARAAQDTWDSAGNIVTKPFEIKDQLENEAWEAGARGMQKVDAIVAAGGKQYERIANTAKSAYNEARTRIADAAISFYNYRFDARNKSSGKELPDRVHKTVEARARVRELRKSEGRVAA